MRFNYFLDRQHRFYIRIFLVLVLFVVITILILSFILFLNFESIATSQINSFVRDNLSKISYSATFMSDTAKTLLLQIYRDNSIKALLNNFISETNSLEVSYLRLKSYMNSTPFIHSIYVYNGSSGNLYFDAEGSSSYISTDFFDKEILDIVTDKEKGKPFIPIPRKIKRNTSLDFENVYTFIFYELPVRHSKEDNLIVLNISEDWMKNIIESLDSNQQGDIFLINNKGQGVISGGNFPMLADLSSERHIQKIINSDIPSGYFLENINGIKSLVTYVSSEDERIDWKFVHIIPYKNITKKIDVMKINTILIGAIILLIGLLISYFTSLKLYNPICKILENLKKLEGEKRRNLHTIKQELLGNFIKTGSQRDLEFIDYNINLDPSGHFIVIILMIDRFSDFCSKYNANDRNIFAFGAMNIVSELSSKQFKNESINMGDHILLLLNLPGNNVLEYEKILDELVNSIQFSVKHYLEISISAVVNTQPGTAGNIGTLYNQALDYTNYRVFYGHGCIIYTDRIPSLKSSEYVYPAKKEKSLINSLMLGKIHEVKSLFNEIIRSTEGFTNVTLNLVFLRLTLAINSSVGSIKKDNGVSILYNSNEFISELNQLETVDEINNQFYKVFEYIVSTLEGRKGHNDLINKVINTINSNYKDPNMNVDALASTIGMSSEYLGRLFRSIISESIADYITAVRVKNAKELLSMTNKSINEISNDVGFSNSNYFYTIFKKLNGITPVGYRQQSREEPSVQSQPDSEALL